METIFGTRAFSVGLAQIAQSTVGSFGVVVIPPFFGQDLGLAYLSERVPQIIELAETWVDMSPGRSHSLLEPLVARILIEPSVASRATEAPTKQFVKELDSALQRILEAQTWLQFEEKVYGIARLYFAEAANEFLCWTFNQITTARRANKFAEAPNKRRSPTLFANTFMIDSSDMADAIRSEDPDQARMRPRVFLHAWPQAPLFGLGRCTTH